MSVNKRIFLVGLMGAGKTTVGGIVSEKLKIPFIDLDSLIESKTGKSINGIFNEKGEECFREIESGLLQESVCRNPEFVMSTGGGILLKKQNRELIQCSGISIYLKASLNTIWNRISTDTSRPLLKVDDPYSALSHLLEERSSLYDKSDYTVVTDGLNPNEVASRIQEIIAGINNG